MKTLFDHQCFIDRYNGVSRYFAELFPLLQRQDVELDLPFTFTQSVSLLSLNLKKFRTLPDCVDARLARRFCKYTGKMECRRELRHGSYDIVHPTQYNPYIFEYAKTPVVVTIHDMIHEIFRDTAYRMSNWDREIANKKECIYRSDKIIAVSENTKRDILRFYPDIPEEKIRVIYHGYRSSSTSAFPNQYGRYILYVGKRGAYKNFTNFLKSIVPLLQADRDLQLVCTGQKFTAAERQLVSELGIADKCSCHFMSESELTNAYRHALVFVYPSLYEGFGLPILEAFSQDCPVCLSNASCFPEIAGDAALYFDPSDIESMCSAIGKVISDQSLRSSLISAGRERAMIFSWERSAAEHVDLYHSLLNR